MREICTAGSAWGDEHKKLCRLGEGTATKVTDNSEAPQRLPFRGSSLPATLWTTDTYGRFSSAGCAMGWCCD